MAQQREAKGGLVPAVGASLFVVCLDVCIEAGTAECVAAWEEKHGGVGGRLHDLVADRAGCLLELSCQISVEAVLVQAHRGERRKGGGHLIVGCLPML